MRRTLVVAIGLMASAIACSSAGEKHDTAADMAAITKVRDGYVAAFKAGNAAAIGAAYTADAHDMGNAQPTAEGSQAVEAATKAMLDQMASQDMVLTAEKTKVVGDVAYEHGHYKTTLTPKGGAAMVEEGRYLVVLRRQSDGSWKLAEDMNNLATAPAPAGMTPMMAPGKAATKAATKAPPKKP